MDVNVEAVVGLGGQEVGGQGQHRGGTAELDAADGALQAPEEEARLCAHDIGMDYEYVCFRLTARFR